MAKRLTFYGLLILGLTSGWTQAQVLVEQMPREVDASNAAGWWHPASNFGSETYFAFNTPADNSNCSGSITNAGNSCHEIEIGVRDVNGNWTFGPLREPNGTVRKHFDDRGHDQPTIAVDGNGEFHVFADMHNTPRGWFYWRGSSGSVLADLRRLPDDTLPRAGSKRTYPIAERAPNGDVWLTVRNLDRESEGGRQAELYKYDLSIGSWSYVAAYAAGQPDNATAYPDDLVVDAVGDVHLVFSFTQGSPGALRHYGNYLRYDVSAGVFRIADGSVPMIPIRATSTAALYQGLDPGEQFVRDTGKGVQGAKIAVSDSGKPSIAYRYRLTGSGDPQDFDIVRRRWNGSQWTTRETIWDSTDTVAALGHSYGGDGVRVYFTTAPNYGLKVAEKVGNGAFSLFDIAKDTPIQRISVVTEPSDLDVVYGSAQQEIDATKGRLYYISVGRNLSDQPTPSRSCLAGTLSGTQQGAFVLENVDFKAVASLIPGNDELWLNSTDSNAGEWNLIDSDGDGEFALQNVATNGYAQILSRTSVPFSGIGSLSDPRRRWRMIDSNEDGLYSVANVSVAPDHLAATGISQSLSIDPIPYANNELWRVCEAS